MVDVIPGSIHIYLHIDSPSTDAKLDVLTTLVRSVLKLEVKMAGELDAIIAANVAEVERQTTVDASILALVTGLGKQLTDALAAAGGSPAQIAALQAVLDKNKANNDAIAAAVTANTPPAA